MRHVCPKDVKKVLRTQVGTAYEELKEGVWLEPTLAMLRRENQGSMDGQAPQCDEEAVRGGTWGAEQTCR